MLPGTRHRPRRALNLRGAVAELRRLGGSTADPAVRARAAELLARLAEHPRARSAHPDQWWGLREITANDVPLHDPAEPLRMSGSSVSTLAECPLKWFLGHEARGQRGTTSAQGFGSIVHAIAAEVVTAGLDPDPEALSEHLDGVWHQLEYAPWVGARERAAAKESIERFCRWHLEHGREVLAAEHRFEVTTEVEGRPVIAQRLDGPRRGGRRRGPRHRPQDPRKTPSGPQDGASTRSSASTSWRSRRARPRISRPARPAAGAELVQLRNDTSGVPGYPKVQPQDAPTR